MTIKMKRLEWADMFSTLQNEAVSLINREYLDRGDEETKKRVLEVVRDRAVAFMKDKGNDLDAVNDFLSTNEDINTILNNTHWGSKICVDGIEVPKSLIGKEV